ncbi:site-specific integrase [Glycomyces artemisiae]|uniref:Site-specific recombinase XerD n=1 Tax=Glycomyces artemisiae TaxID=1076443 RepID=A0A2T0UI21_9ACTN|nr:site-specific integrase [Glycomyces artemisiae]PRY57487.1 site-specific recombinase XerD [Glycomyces artemisiae]
MAEAKRPRKQARKGDGSIYWDEANGCYVGSISLGTKPDGSRNRPSVRGATVKEVKHLLKELKEDHDDGIELGDKYTVEQACRDFIARGLTQQDGKDVRTHINTHLIPGLGKAKLKRLTADDVDDFLATKRATHSTSYISRLLGTLRRVIRFAERRNKVRRNVAELVEAPSGTEGRPSKALTLDQGKAVIRKCRESREPWIYAYVAISMYTGVRTEEARPLKWEHTHLNPVVGEECSCGRRHRETMRDGSPVPPHVEVWRSVRKKGETKNQKSRRTIALPDYVVAILAAYRLAQVESRERNGHEHERIVYVFGTRNDTVKDAGNVRRYFQTIVEDAKVPGSWTPRELRHTFVSWMSDEGASEELIADLVGHAKTSTTRTVYRHQLRPVITKGVELLEEVFSETLQEP